MTTKSLEERIAELEAIEAIKRLKATYAMHADAKYTDRHARKPQEVVVKVARLQASCFTEDAEWDAGQWGVLRGRDALTENFATKPWRFAMHHFVSPIIEVDGDRAKGTWTMWMLGTVASSGECLHLSGYTYDEYRKVDGQWLISRIRVVDKFLTPFTRPWSEADGPSSYKIG